MIDQIQMYWVIDELHNLKLIFDIHVNRIKKSIHPDLLDANCLGNDVLDPVLRRLFHQVAVQQAGKVAVQTLEGKKPTQIEKEKRINYLYKTKKNFFLLDTSLGA